MRSSNDPDPMRLVTCSRPDRWPQIMKVSFWLEAPEGAPRARTRVPFAPYRATSSRAPAAYDRSTERLPSSGSGNDIVHIVLPCDLNRP
jgi:hypothetical protein